MLKPCEKTPWHEAHFAWSTTARRGTTGEPSTLKSRTTFCIASCTVPDCPRDRDVAPRFHADAPGARAAGRDAVGDRRREGEDTATVRARQRSAAGAEHGRRGHRRRQAAEVARRAADRERKSAQPGDAREQRAVPVRQPERDGDGAAGAAARGEQLAHQALELRRALRHGVRARHRDAELGVRSRTWQSVPQKASGCAPATWFAPGAPAPVGTLARIHVVVTPGAGGRRRLREVVTGGGTLAVTHGAAPDVLREADAGDRRPRAGAVRAVAVAAARHAGKRAAGTGAHLLGEGRVPEPDDLVRRAERCRWSKARQLVAAMDAVDHLLQLDRVPALRSKP